MSDEILKYVVSRLNERTKQVGKTTVQKIMYFLKGLGIVDYEYTMHYYGPYSSEVENSLRQLESSNQLRISWNPDREGTLSGCLKNIRTLILIQRRNRISTK